MLFFFETVYSKKMIIHRWCFSSVGFELKIYLIFRIDATTRTEFNQMLCKFASAIFSSSQVFQLYETEVNLQTKTMDVDWIVH